MPLFKDRNDQHVFLNQRDVSAIAPGGTEHTCIVYLRGGQHFAVAGSVLDVWHALGHTVGIEKSDEEAFERGAD
jgi:hypothetical protein